MSRGRIGPGGLAGLQNRDGGAFGDSGGFDSHTLPPPRPPARWCVPGLAVLAALLATPAQAQDTTTVSPSLVIIQQQPAPAPPPVPPDTLRYRPSPVSPMGSFFRSLVVPGWSQAKLNRRLTAGLFVAWEGVSLGMTLKAGSELRFLEAEGTDSLRIESKKQERQDWLVLLAFNHLFAGLEAFVSSHLWDFPVDVSLRAIPHGAGLGVTVPLRLP